MTYLRLDKNFLFVHTVKCAGGSIEAALKQSIGKSDRTQSRRLLSRTADVLADWRYIVSGASDTVGGDVATSIRSPLPMRSTGPMHRFLGLRRFQTISDHTSNVEVREIIGPERWALLHRFAVTRHPYERAISIYFGHTNQSQSIDQWLSSNPQQLLEWQLRTASRLFGMRQTKYMRNFELEWDSKMTFLRLDALREDIAQMCGLLHLDVELFRSQLDRNRLHASGRPSSASPAELLSQRSRTFIDYLCESEFERFGYARY